MANRTDPTAATVHGTNPQNLVEYIVRCKIYDCQYWKEHCFGLTAESLIDKAVELRSCGGTFGGARKPCEFMCLTLKLLQLQPEKDIIIEYIKNDQFKYVRILGAFYLRLVGKPMEVYQYLEPLLIDNRKIRVRNLEGSFALSHVDECVDDMLHNDLMYDITLPRIPHRLMLERTNQLKPRTSVLDDNFDEEALMAEAELAAQTEAANGSAAALKTTSHDGARESRSRSRSRERAEEKKRERWRPDHKSRPRDRGTEGPPDHGMGHSERARERDRDRRSDRPSDRPSDRHDTHSARDREEERYRDHRSHRRRRSRSRSRSHDAERYRKSSRRDGGHKRRRDSPLPPPPSRGGGGKDSMTVEESNALRAKAGLKPLK